MNKGRRIFSFILLLALIGYMRYRRTHQQVDPKVAEVDSLPTGIEVVHTPSTVKAVEGLQQNYRYTWPYETSVRSTVGSLKIVEFGAFGSVRGKWVFTTYTGKKFTGDDFASWYDCPNAELTATGTFTDHHNWTGGAALPKDPTLSRWYYIGVDPSGKRYNGEAIVKGLPELSASGK